MLSIENLKSAIIRKGGMARNNLFMVKLPSLANIESRELNVLCKSATMPGKQIATVEKQIGIRIEKVAYAAMFDEVQLTFYMLNDFGLKKYFDAWMDLIIDSETNTVGYKKDYAKYIEIASVDPRVISNSIAGYPLINQNLDTQRTNYSIKLHSAFPTTANAIELTSEPDGLIEYNVMLSYSKWVAQ